ncbi:hypothetical protein HPB52_025513 [Rhipicephalus sanguineus]|uniref:Regulatory protein zeste n=1 Tax=Rhipicephalus sanguineus TaxID=34632 RepID=A0A9D4TCT8_RHISA|nr:hypothetical protein HPB52_025513 [Rhipicephalus sanguineus]
MSAKGPRVSKVQRDMLIQFLEQHPYLGRSCTEVSPRMTAARKKQLWQEIATLLNQQGPARHGWRRRVGGVDGRVLDILERTGAVVTTPPEYYPVPDVPQPRRRQPRQLEEAVCRATAEYVRQGQCADARAVADRKFHHKMLEQNRRHHEAQMASQERLENQLCRLTEEVGRLRHVQQQRLDQERRANDCTQRLLQQLLEALAVFNAFKLINRLSGTLT